MEAIISLVPDYAKDLRINLPNVLAQQELTPQQAWGTALSCAMVSGSATLLKAVAAEAGAKLSPEAVTGAKTAAALMGMNNVYYRFQHLASNQRYAELPARLRMQGIRTHGADPVDFELWCLAVSAVNGCGKCIDAHERVVKEKGISEEQIVAAVRIASVVKAVAAVLIAEEAMKA